MSTGTGTGIGVQALNQALRAQAIWSNLASQLTPNNIQLLIMIPDHMFVAFNNYEVTFIQNSYGLITGYGGFFIHDAALNRIILGPGHVLGVQPLVHVPGQLPTLPSPNLAQPIAPQMTPLSSSGGSASVAGPLPTGGGISGSLSSSIKIPRPPNAFIIYRKSHHAEIVAQNPGVHNNQISVIIGGMWNRESPEVRADFKAQAERLKQQHLQLHPDYQYRPRKPSEKKKRMSKKKAAALAEKAAETRTKSLTIASEYSSIPQQSEQFVSTTGEIQNLTLPVPAASLTNSLDQNIPARETHLLHTGSDFAPSSEYDAAQAADMAFFPELDETDPYFQALMEEVSEAFEAGYYDDTLINSGLASHNLNYVSSPLVPTGW